MWNSIVYLLLAVNNPKMKLKQFCLVTSMVIKKLGSKFNKSIRLVHWKLYIIEKWKKDLNKWKCVDWKTILLRWKSIPIDLQIQYSSFQNLKWLFFFFCQNWQADLKIYVERQRTQNSQIILKQTKVRTQMLFTFKTYSEQQ